jgi:hypothetical protein
MSVQPPPQKMCVACGTDVAGQKRTKDAAGNYYCASCWVAKSTPQKTASQPRPPAIPPAQSGTEFVIRGTDKITGTDLSLRVQAASQDAATAQIQAKGIKWQLIYDATETPKPPVVPFAELDGWRAAEAARLNPIREKNYSRRWIPLLCVAVAIALAMWCAMDGIMSIGAMGQMNQDVAAGANAHYFRAAGNVTTVYIVRDFVGFVVLLGGAIGCWLLYRSWSRKPIL